MQSLEVKMNSAVGVSERTKKDTLPQLLTQSSNKNASNSEQNQMKTVCRDSELSGKGF